MPKPISNLMNVGTGVDCSICKLAGAVARVSGFKGKLVFDASKPDGTARKLMDVGRLSALDWHAAIGVDEGQSESYAWYVQNVLDLRG